MSKYFRLNIHETPETFRYPEDFETIKSYLEEKGTIYCSNKELEKMWEEFSDRYYSESWLKPEPKSLEWFAEWLDEYESF